MDKDLFELWVRETGIRAPVWPVAADEPLRSDGAEQRDLIGVPDLDIDDLGDDGLRGSEDCGQPGGHRENTELVAAVFRAEGDPKYQDVKLRAAKTSNSPGPTHREFARQRAKRRNGSPAW
jgi:hypothetical protein